MSPIWQNKKIKLRKRFTFIREKDLKYRVGEEKDLMNKLSEKLGKSNEEILGMLIDL